jgi:hypothetical protein
MIGRRQFCYAGLAGVAALAPGGFAAAGSAGAAAFTRAPAVLSAYRRMRYVEGGAMGIGWLRAKRLAVSEGEVRPLCGMLAASFSKVRQVSEAGFEVVVTEVTHYTDYETGELLETLVMPFTGREVAVPSFRHGPALSRTAIELDESERYAPRQGSTEGEYAPAGTVLMTKSLGFESIDNGDLFLRHEEYGRVYPDNAQRASLFYRESTLWSAPLADVLDLEQAMVRSTVSYAAMTSWRPWMQMGDLPGHTASNGVGHRVRAVDELPADFLAFTERVHPGFLDNPAADLERL